VSGLFGYVAKERAPEACASVVAAMGARLHHTQRARTSFAGFHTEQVAGAVGHIGIGIFNAGEQPRHGAEGRVALWMCGEFYHHEAVQTGLVRAGVLSANATDEELALHLYLQEGAEAIARLEGAFTVAIWDGREGVLTLVNDRYALYPHFWSRLGGGFSFAPEIKTFYDIPGFRASLDVTAVAQYVRFQQLLGERTWVDGVQMVAPASIMRYTPATDRLQCATYWDWGRIGAPEEISFPEAAEETTRLFKRAIDAMSKPPHRIGVYLSGGLDGRTILAHLNHPKEATTVTFGATGCRDVVYGMESARRAGSRNIWFPIDDGAWVQEHAHLHLEMTEGRHNWMNMHGIQTIAAVSQEVDVHLSGWDGGTILGGRIDAYGASDHYFRHAPNEAQLESHLRDGFLSKFTWPGLTDAEARQLFRPSAFGGDVKDLLALADDSFQAEFSRTREYPSPYRADFFYIRQRVCRSTHNMIVFQRAGFEVRCPYFDYSLVDFLYRLPEAVYAAPDLHRHVLTSGSPELARVPYDANEELPHANPQLRAQHRAQRKAKRLLYRGLRIGEPQRPRVYADYENYLRHELRAWAEGFLFDKRLMEQGYFHPPYISTLWQRHLAGNEPWTIGKFASLITLAMVLDSLALDSSARPQ